MHMTQTTVTAHDGAFGAYLAIPTDPNGYAIVVIQEIFGVNQVMRDLCDQYAAQGYLAICPDLFWRIEPGIDITDQSKAEWDKAFSLYSAFDVDKGVEDLADTITAARSLTRTGKVATIGYCLGGLLAYLTMTRTDADAGVSYYGVGIDQKLDEAAAITRPLLLHIAEEDGFVSKPAQTAIVEVMAARDPVITYSYPGLDHAFARIGGAHYDAAGAKLASDRTTTFLLAMLG
jgi:carboxymethylenebutenolidase